MSENIEASTTGPIKMTSLTLDEIRKQLAERVTGYNAKLLLHHAIVKSGVPTEMDSPLNEENAKSICMALISKGGPSFQVGKHLFQQIH